MLRSARISMMVLAAVLAAPTMHAAILTELLLHDGTVLGCDKLKLEDENYLVTLKDGEVITLPAELVESVRVTGTGEPPTGIRVGQAETIVGPEVRPPTSSEQLDAFGPSSRFREAIVDNSWKPSTDWEMDPEIQNNFAPSTWPRNVIEPVWRPKSAWEVNDDVLASGRAQWRKPIIDPSWSPTDAFSGGMRQR